MYTVIHSDPNAPRPTESLVQEDFYFRLSAFICANKQYRFGMNVTVHDPIGDIIRISEWLEQPEIDLSKVL
jgi:hypothetical protein